VVEDGAKTPPIGPAPTHGDRRADAAHLIAGLRQLRARARLLTVARVLAAGLAAALLAVFVAALADYVLRTPSALRGVLLLLGLTAGGWWIWTRLRPALAFRPSLPAMALRVEQTEAGERAGLRGWLASAVEFMPQGDTTPLDTALRRRVIDRAAGAFPSVRARDVIDTRGFQRQAVNALFVVVAVAVVVVAAPGLAGTGVQRILTPWAGAEWPSRTEIVDVTATRVHPMGVALPIRGVLTRTNKDTGATDVTVRYRVVGEGRPGAWRTALLTSQGSRDIVNLSRAAEGALSVVGEPFERLIDPPLPPAPLDTGEAGPAELTLEYTLETEDDRTPRREVLLVRAPQVLGAALAVSPPGYAEEIPSADFVRGAVDLGPGSDERAIAGPVLAGSAVELTVRLNKPLPRPGALEPRAAARAVLGDALGPEAAGDLDADFDGDTWTFRWTALASARLPVLVTDRHGLTNEAEAVYSLDVRDDAAPRLALLEPERDEAVLPTAVVPVRAELIDDVGAAWLAIEHERASAPEGSEGAPVESTGEVARFARAEAPRPVRRLEASHTLDLEPLALLPGDELWLTAIGLDTFAFEGEAREPVRTAIRRLRIISESTLVEQVQAELNGLRDAAIRLDEQQGELRRQVGLVGVTSENRRGQTGVGERLAALDEQARRLQDRAERNRLDDQALDDLLAETRDLVARAGEASSNAARQLARLDQQEAPPPAGDAAYDDTLDEQRAVQEELERLIGLLDRGEDAWVVRRELDRLIEEQLGLRAETEAAGRELLGRPESQLTSEERSRLAELAERQAAAAERTEDVLDALSDRARALRETDPAEADAMQIAAQQGRQSQASQSQREAAEAVEQNQTNQAQQAQDEALEALEEVREALDEAGRNRDEALRRLLETLIASIDRLIRTQASELARLEAMGEAPTGLDAAMIRLRDNTLAVAAEARAEARELERVASLIEGAAEAQEQAIGALRAEPPDAARAADRERAALERLREAKEEAEQLQRDAENRDNARQRDELRKAYLEALELQVGVREESEGFVGADLSRRQRVVVRSLGERQEAIRLRLADLRERTEALSEAAVFDFTHDRLDDKTASAASGLKSGRPGRRGLIDQDAAVRALQSLVRALAEDEQDETFREDEGGGGGGGGGQGEPPPPIPPIAELKLLRDLQQEAADLTRLAHDDPRSATPDDRRAIGEMQRALAELGLDLVERAQQQQQQQPGMGPGGPRITPGPERGPNGEPIGPDGANGPEGSDVPEAEPGDDPGRNGDGEPE